MNERHRNHELAETRRHIGQRVRALRNERRWTQRELAELLDISQARLSEIERGGGSFTAEQLLIILRLFNVDVSSFDRVAGDDSSELQNALVRLGARHLRHNPDVQVSEAHRHPSDVARALLLDPRSERLVTALAPVLVWSVDEVALPGLQDRLVRAGVPNRLGWLVENTLAAIRSRPATAIPPSPEWARRLRRAETVLDTFASRLQSHRTDPLAPPPLDLLDRGIRTTRTRDRVWNRASEISRRWGVVSALQIDDFAASLWGAVGSGQ